jgi:hypothetical protein
METTISEQAIFDRWIFRIGGAAAILGALVGLVGNLNHPETPGTIDPEGTARVVAESQNWVPVHLGLILGFLLMLGGLVAIHHSLSVGLPGVLARFGLVAAIVGTTVGVVILTIDGFASKHLAKFWPSTPPDLQATALGSFRTEQAVDFALLSPLNLVFSGFTFVLFGLAAALSQVYPRWLGWIVVVAGLGGAAAGVIQAYMGMPTPFSTAMGIGAPTIITLWLLVMGILLGRNGFHR